MFSSQPDRRDEDLHRRRFGSGRNVSGVGVREQRAERGREVYRGDAHDLIKRSGSLRLEHVRISSYDG
jgi:hypothetical protein